MAAPTPKHPSERRNRTPPARGEWIEIDARTIDEPMLPEQPPKLRPFFVWRKCALAKWKQWRLDPASQFWGEGDLSFALSTLEFYNVQPATDWMNHAAEIRQREDRLGLTPKGKRDLRYKITFGPGETARKDKPLPENVVPIDERRQQLSHGG